MRRQCTLPIHKKQEEARAMPTMKDGAPPHNMENRKESLVRE
jgi:hypothetical protein